MISDRMQGIAGFGIDRVAAGVEGNPDVLRLENLDTDLPPPAGVLEATRAATGTREGNSWLPFVSSCSAALIPVKPDRTGPADRAGCGQLVPAGGSVPARTHPP